MVIMYFNKFYSLSDFRFPENRMIKILVWTYVSSFLYFQFYIFQVFIQSYFIIYFGDNDLGRFSSSARYFINCKYNKSWQS